MSDPLPSKNDPSEAALDRIDAICGAFELQLRAGAQPRIEDYAGQVAEADRPRLLHELALIEQAYNFAESMIDSGSDRNLLFGILALQLDFIGRDALVTAMNAWVLDKKKSLGEILLEQRDLDGEMHALLSALVEKHLSQHGGNAQKSLEALSSLGSARQDLEKIVDAKVQATLSMVARSAPEEADDPKATVSHLGAPSMPAERYRVLRPHAKGGIGVVYVAHDEELNREVALKEILFKQADNPASRTRFLLEAEITGGLEHPGIVPVYGLGTYGDGRPYYAMRFIRGDSLQSAIKEFHKSGETMDGVRFRELLGRFLDVCDAIQYAHDRGVLHRDLKPGNIMLGKYGETLVVDWGLAKASGRVSGDGRVTSDEAEGNEPRREGDCEKDSTRRDEPPLKPRSGSDYARTILGSAIGTPAFMSPEQAAGRIDQLGPASDVYSLGATLYTLLTGQTPIHDSARDEKNKADIGKLLRKVQQGDFCRPREVNSVLHPALEAVCLKAMALHPSDRYTSPAKLADDVKCWLAGQPVTAWPEPITVKIRRWAEKHHTLLTASAATLIVGIIGLIVAFTLVTYERDKVQIANNALSKESGKVKKANQKLVKLNQILDQRAGELAQSLEKEEAAIKAERIAANKLAHSLAKGRSLLAQFYFKQGDITLAKDTLSQIEPRFRTRGWQLLRRQMDESLLTLYGHVDAVTNVAFSPDGRRLASASRDGTVKVWDARTGQELHSLEGHTSDVTSVAYSPDGLRIASASADKTVKMWNAQDGKELFTLRDQYSVTSVAFSPNGKRLATANGQRAKLWDVVTGKELLTGFDRASRELSSISCKFITFSPNAPRLALADENMLVVLDSITFKRVMQYSSTDVFRLAFSPDGDQIAVGMSEMSATPLQILHASTGQRIQTLQHSEAASFSPDGQRLASASRGAIRLWNAKTGENLLSMRGHFSLGVNDLEFTPDGQRIASAGEDGTIKLWNARTSDELLALKADGEIRDSVSFSADGQLLIASNTKSVNIWDPWTGKTLATLEHPNDTNRISVSSNGEFAAVVREDGMIKVWNPMSNHDLHIFKGHSDRNVRLVFSRDGQRLASHGQMALKLWDTQKGKEVLVIENKKAGSSRSVNIEFNNDGQRLLHCEKTYSEKRTAPKVSTSRRPIGPSLTGHILTVWNTQTAQKLFTLKIDQHIPCVAFSPDGKSLAWRGADTNINVSDVLTGKVYLTLEPQTESVYQISYSPDGKRLLTWEREAVTLWDLLAKQKLCTLSGEFKNLIFSPEGDLLLGFYRNQIVLLDAHTGQFLRAFRDNRRAPLTGSEVRLAFSRCGRRIAATFRSDSLVRVWDVDTDQSCLTLEGHLSDVQSIALAPTGQKLASVSSDNSLNVWDLRTGNNIMARKVSAGRSNNFLTFDVTGERLAMENDRTTVRVWDLLTRRELCAIKANFVKRTIVFSPDGGQIAAAINDDSTLGGNESNEIKVWSVQTGRIHTSLGKCGDVVDEIVFSSNGSWIKAKLRSGKTVVWNAQTGKRVKRRVVTRFLPSNRVRSARRGWEIDRFGTKMAFAIGNQIEVFELSPPSQSELIRRVFATRFRADWHEEQSMILEDALEPSTFAIAFHRGQLALRQPGDGKAVDALVRARAELAKQNKEVYRLADEQFRRRVDVMRKSVVFPKITRLSVALTGSATMPLAATGSAFGIQEQVDYLSDLEAAIARTQVEPKEMK